VVVVRVTVDLAERSYDVVVEPGARHQLAALVAARAPRAAAVAIVASERIQRQPWFDLDPGVASSVVTVPDGEGAKRLETVEALCTRFAEMGLSRRDLIVSAGGGAATDVAGFAAAVYLRGVAVVHVATSLVAQVDAAIGGKTGVNLAVGKNLVGAFHQPLGVLCDLETLATLPERERRCGLGEIAKCWLLEGHDANELRERGEAAWVAAAVGLKATIVSADERESGARALLNYGHTLAHALEAEQLGGHEIDLAHGEAVAIGLAFAVRLAWRLGRVAESEVARHDAVLDALGLPRTLPDGLSHERLLAAMGRDKKAHHSLSFVLDGPDGFELVSGIDPAQVLAALEEFEGER
jgi:5-deoxy-5-amino-3-dehydroquinate synthase